MGLIKAGLGALGGTLADQWKEFFYCEALENDVLVTKGVKKTGSRSSNTKGSDNVISNGSGIAVADGQAMIIVENGKVVEFCAEPGEFTYKSDMEPSIFTGSLGESIKSTFKEIGKRFTFGGEAAKDQRVYYFNTKEIADNLFGTPEPVPFRVIIDEAKGFKISVDIRCNGEYSYRITNPILFYTNVCGNISDSYERSEIDTRLKSELKNALQPALAKLSAARVQYYEIPAHTMEISAALNEILSPMWRDKRGIEIYSLNINSLSIPEEQKKKITEWEENAMTSDAATAGARLVGAQVESMKTAAGNAGGAALGFMGMNMAGNMAGGNAGTMFSMASQNSPAQPKATTGSWKCSCGAEAMGNFCAECGAKRPENNDWKCTCGAVNTGKFCSECGTKKPEAKASYKCSKCGYVPEDPTNPPKFCPECGDPFNDSDKI